MKKVIFILLLFVSNNYAQQAIMKGAYTVGGSISYSSYSEGDNSDNQNFFIVAPSFGYFFIDHFYTGLQLQYSHFSSGDYSNSTVGFGPEIRYYFTLDKVNPFLGVSYSYIKNTSGDDNDVTTNSLFTISGGVDYFITSYFAIEGSINYSFITRKFSGGNFNNKQDANQFNIGLGAKYFIF